MIDSTVEVDATLACVIDAAHRRTQDDIDEAVATLALAQTYHHATGRTPEPMAGDGTPPVDEFVVQELAAALHRSVDSVHVRVMGLLNLAYRHPILWAAVVAGHVRVHDGVDRAMTASHLAHDQAMTIDRSVSPFSGLLGAQRFRRYWEAAVITADPDHEKAQRLVNQARKCVWFQPAHAGTTDMSARIDPTHALWFNAMLTQVATLLSHHGHTGTLDQRRADAIGILATPARALALLQSTQQPTLPCGSDVDAGGAEGIVLNGLSHLRGASDTRDIRAAGETGQENAIVTINSTTTTSSTVTHNPTGTTVPTVARHATIANDHPATCDPTRDAQPVPVGADTAASTATNHAAIGTVFTVGGTLPVGVVTGCEPAPLERRESAGSPDVDDSATPAPGPAGCTGHTCGQITVHPDRLLPKATLVIHLSDHSLTTHSGTARVERIGPVLTEHLTDLLAHTRVTVLPVLNPDHVLPVDSYEIPEHIRRAVLTRHPYEVFPYSSRPSAHLDLDHTRPYDHRAGCRPGQTSPDNLGPLTRAVHRAKTHGGHQLDQPTPGTFRWTTPLGRTYTVTPTGLTIDHQRVPAPWGTPPPHRPDPLRDPDPVHGSDPAHDPPPF